MTYNYPSQMAGDILLLNGESKLSKANRLGQTVKEVKHARYSHVAFCLGVGKIIHSVKNKNGVRSTLDLCWMRGAGRC